MISCEKHTDEPKLLQCNVPCTVLYTTVYSQDSRVLVVPSKPWAMVICVRYPVALRR